MGTWIWLPRTHAGGKKRKVKQGSTGSQYSPLSQEAGPQASQPHLFGKLQISKKNCLKTQEKQYPGLCLHMHAYTDMHAQIHMNTYTVYVCCICIVQGGGFSFLFLTSQTLCYPFWFSLWRNPPIHPLLKVALRQSMSLFIVKIRSPPTCC